MAEPGRRVARKLDAYTVVFLRRPPDAPVLSEEALDALQQRHLAFYTKMRDEGHVVFNGPFSGQPDESLRGIAVYRRSVEEARRLAHQDPSVEAGRLVVDVFTWYMQPGALGDRPASRFEEN
jgi:uncharacterized protein YciI